ncbi:hypothetical protein HMPREF1870_02740 [Bacteroidales bacterium KA00344]|nr:hypothetical protein HMPREF1870_02740 [Bacteroidales bacterium KA00344]
MTFQELERIEKNSLQADFRLPAGHFIQNTHEEILALPYSRGIWCIMTAKTNASSQKFGN